MWRSHVVRRSSTAASSHATIWAHQRFDSSPIAQSYYTALLSPLQARLAQDVLHVGCSLGRATLGACYQVGRPGSVTALEIDPEIIKYARGNQGRERQKVLGWAIPSAMQNEGTSMECSGCVLKGEACVPKFDSCLSFAKLPFADAVTFDCVLADRVLHRVDRRVACDILHELARRTSPGGRLVLGIVDDREAAVGRDSASRKWFSTDAPLELNDLPGLLAALGVTDVKLTEITHSDSGDEPACLAASGSSAQVSTNLDGFARLYVISGVMRSVE